MSIRNKRVLALCCVVGFISVLLSIGIIGGLYKEIMDLIFAMIGVTVCCILAAFCVVYLIEGDE